MALASRTRATLREYWADRLGVTPTAFTRPGVAVGPANEGGIQLFVGDGWAVVGAPASLVRTVETRADALDVIEYTVVDGGDGSDADDADHTDHAGDGNADAATAVRSWLESFDAVERVIGPTFYGYADWTAFDPIDSAARPLEADDEPAYDALRNAVPDEEWERGGTPLVPGETVGHFVDDELVALAGYAVWDDLLAHIAVVVHPGHRGDGHGRRVVSRVTELALENGLLAQYRTADAWPWSVDLAEGLGFERFATASLGIVEE